MQPGNLHRPVRAHIELPVTTHSASALLAAGIPLTLIIDLAEPNGPLSRDVYETEKPDLSWLEPRRLSASY